MKNGYLFKGTLVGIKKWFVINYLVKELSGKQNLLARFGDKENSKHL